MASFYLQGPAVVRSFSLCASSSGAPSMSQKGGPFVLELPLDKTQKPLMRRSFSVRASSNGAPSKTQQGGPLVLELPLDKIRRPLMRTRANDPQKVKELMDSIQEIGLQVPIDVLEVDGVYYGFSGCHRYEAHQRLGLPTIRCKIRRATKEILRLRQYLKLIAHGASFPTPVFQIEISERLLISFRSIFVRHHLR